MLRILLYTEGALQEIRELLSAHSVEKTGKKEELILRAISGSYDLIILDNSIDLIPAVTAADPRAEIFVLADNCVDAIEPLKMGATACFTCPIDGDRFQKALESVIAQVNLMNETDALERLLVEKYTYAGIVARNPQMLELFRFLRKIAPYYRAVTIAGETGTGKEAIARALHALSPLGRQPFIACNCGGLVENLVESEFFGHVKGAFTGANSDKTGVFEAAGEGVVFLDEIGDLPLSFQPHLLRVLQNGEFRKLGSAKPLKTSCKVISATNKDLPKEVREGRFREDLYFRLTPLSVHVPPLRDRKDDIPLLSRFILDKFQNNTGKKMIGISRPAQKALMSHDWPGNVRELENVIEQAAILASEPFVNLEHLNSSVRRASGDDMAPLSSSRPLDEVVRGHIAAVLCECGGNRTRAAEALGISRRALIRKIEKHSIE